MTEISRQDLHAAMVRNEIIVVDTLAPTYWSQEHLPGAINLPIEDVEKSVAAILPDKSAWIATYCSSRLCSTSHAVAGKLARLGYSNIVTYRGGLQDWVEAGLPTQSSAAAS